MKKPKLLLFSFIIISLSISGFSLWYSNILKTKLGDAASFGISPPYLNFEKLKPGDEASASIRVMRGDSDSVEYVTARFDGLENADWIEILPSETAVFDKGQNMIRFTFNIKVPEDANREKNKGKLFFAVSSNDKKGGVAIALGARADVEIEISEGKDPVPQKTSEKKEIILQNNALVERLQGMFIMRAQSNGQIYYLEPEEKKMFHLSGTEDFSNLIKYSARGISNELLNKIPLDLSMPEGVDSDGDGLSDKIESAIGTNTENKDTDSDGFNDFDEIKGNFSPYKKDKNLELDYTLTKSLAGFVLLQTEKMGYIWYVDPKTEKRVLIDVNNFLYIVKRLALGISEENFGRLFR